MQSAVASTTSQQIEPALPLRTHTILGVCEAIGEDFGFNPVLLRVPLAAMVLWSPLWAIVGYFGLGAIVLASRLLFPNRRTAVAEATTQSTIVQSNDRANDSMSENKVQLAA